MGTFLKALVIFGTLTVILELLTSLLEYLDRFVQSAAITV